MKKLVLVFTVLLSVVACQTKSAHESNSRNPRGTNPSDTSFSKFIPVDSANKMISSYLNSLSDTDSSLQSLIIDAGQLERYMDSASSSGSITHLKLCFAHTLAYINSGHGNQKAGYKTGALTLILVGYDSLGNYVYFNANQVLEYMAPCPYSCPVGQAGQPLLQTVQSLSK